MSSVSAAGRLQDLLAVSEMGDVNAVKRCLASGTDVDAANAEDVTALQVAAANDQVEVVRLLLSLGANPSKSNSCGWTALHQACFHGHTDVARLLLHAGASIKTGNKLGASPLCVAAASGYTSTARFLLEHGAPVDEDVDTKTSSGIARSVCPSPAATAALYASDGVLRLLLDKKPSVVESTSPATSWTPLMFAAAAGSKACAQLLVRGAANVDQTNAVGNTALDVAEMAANNEVRAFLEPRTTIRTTRERKRPPDEFFDAIRCGNVRRVEALLAESAVDINIRESTSGSATGLMVAAVCGHAAVASALVSNGADVDEQDDLNGWTALMQAVFYGHKDVAKVLVAAGADPTLTAANGCTALDMATLVEESDSDLLRYLAGRTVEFVPPSISFVPARERKSGKAAFRRSRSEAALDSMPNDGKGNTWAWLDKMANTFVRLSGGRVNSATNIKDFIRSSNQHVHDATLDLDANVFTLGFSSRTSNLSSYELNPTVPPHFRSEKLNSAWVTSHFAIAYDRKTLHHGGRKKPASDRRQEKDNKHRDSSMVNGKHSHIIHKEGAEKGGHTEFYNSSSKPPKSVRTILKRLSLEKFASVFEEQEIDMDAFRQLTDTDLRELGVAQKAARMSILKAIKHLSQ